MPFVVNQGVRIHYESIGNGPTLVMHHGTLGSGTDFIDCGYVDALKADHQVTFSIREVTAKATSRTIPGLVCSPTTSTPCAH
jgi:pimeloyl-ACP methyl ester carboxylesterase